MPSLQIDTRTLQKTGFASKAGYSDTSSFSEGIKEYFNSLVGPNRDQALIEIPVSEGSPFLGMHLTPTQSVLLLDTRSWLLWQDDKEYLCEWQKTKEGNHRLILYNAQGDPLFNEQKDLLPQSKDIRSILKSLEQGLRDYSVQFQKSTE